MNPDRLAELEDERRFLLRSLRDLDAELVAGDVDRDDYETLRDGYTKRAADVLREIGAGRDSLPSPRPARWPRRLAVAAAVVAVALGAGWVVARSSGQRLGDDGGGAAGGVDDVATVLARARALISVDPAGAQELYARVLAERPEHPEALAYSGFLLFDASSGAGAELRRTAVDAARAQLDRAVEADATYADPHCFLAVIAADAGELETARTERETCFALDPPAQLRELVTRSVTD